MVFCGPGIRWFAQPDSLHFSFDVFSSLWRLPAGKQHLGQAWTLGFRAEDSKRWNYTSRRVWFFNIIHMPYAIRSVSRYPLPLLPASINDQLKHQLLIHAMFEAKSLASISLVLPRPMERPESEGITGQQHLSSSIQPWISHQCCRYYIHIYYKCIQYMNLYDSIWLSLLNLSNKGDSQRNEQVLPKRRSALTPSDQQPKACWTRYCLRWTEMAVGTMFISLWYGSIPAINKIGTRESVTKWVVQIYGTWDYCNLLDVQLMQMNSDSDCHRWKNTHTQAVSFQAPH